MHTLHYAVVEGHDVIVPSLQVRGTCASLGAMRACFPPDTREQGSSWLFADEIVVR